MEVRVCGEEVGGDIHPVGLADRPGPLGIREDKANSPDMIST